MIQANKIIAIIPARGGSKGVPKKNIRKVDGIPLIAHSIMQAKNSALVDQVFVSTDCDEIAAVATDYGALVIQRPSELANDTASSESALHDALDQIKKSHDLEPELVVFLQCTSPIRDEGDIDNAIQLLKDEKADSLLSVVDNHRFIWEMKDGQAQSINYNYKARQRRQDLTPQYCENGSIYIFSPEGFRKYNNRLFGEIVLYNMCPESNYEIDSLLDLRVVESIIQQLKNAEK